MAGVDVKIKGLSELQEKLEKAGRKAQGGLQEALKPSAERFNALIQESFAREQDASGKAWEKVTPAYQRQKTKDGYGNKTLTRTGMLARTSLAASVKGGIRFSTSPLAPYGGVHQFGEKERKFFPFTGKPGALSIMDSGKVDKIMAQMREDIFNYLFGGSKSVGGFGRIK